MKTEQLRKLAVRPTARQSGLDAPLTITLPANLSATVRYVAHLKGITPEEEVLNGLVSMNSDIAQTIYSDSSEAEAWLLGREPAGKEAAA